MGFRLSFLSFVFFFSSAFAQNAADPLAAELPQCLQCNEVLWSLTLRSGLTRQVPYTSAAVDTGKTPSAPGGWAFASYDGRQGIYFYFSDQGWWFPLPAKAEPYPPSPFPGAVKEVVYRLWTSIPGIVPHNISCTVPEAEAKEGNLQNIMCMTASQNMIPGPRPKPNELTPGIRVTGANGLRPLTDRMTKAFEILSSHLGSDVGGYYESLGLGNSGNYQSQLFEQKRNEIAKAKSLDDLVDAKAEAQLKLLKNTLEQMKKLPEDTDFAKKNKAYQVRMFQKLVDEFSRDKYALNVLRPVGMNPISDDDLKKYLADKKDGKALFLARLDKLIAEAKKDEAVMVRVRIDEALAQWKACTQAPSLPKGAAVARVVAREIEKRYRAKFGPLAVKPGTKPVKKPGVPGVIAPPPVFPPEAPPIAPPKPPQAPERVLLGPPQRDT